MKNRKQITMNIGIISFMIVFVILCLVVFAVLSLVSAHSNLNSTQTSLEHITSYYEISDKAEYVLKEIDEKLYTLYSESSSQKDYFYNLQSLTLDSHSIHINQHDIEFIVSDNQQTIQVVIEVLYPGEKLYEMKAWNTVIEEDI